MKKRSLCLLIIGILCLTLSACSQPVKKTDIWAEAMYTENTEFGEGLKTVYVEVIAEDKSVTFTLNTDKETLGEALLEHKLIEGDQGAYGMYVKRVNGILADYDINKCYWGFNKNGESMMTGVDGAAIADGDRFELVYTK